MLGCVVAAMPGLPPIKQMRGHMGAGEFLWFVIGFLMGGELVFYLFCKAAELW